MRNSEEIHYEESILKINNMYSSLCYHVIAWKLCINQTQKLGNLRKNHINATSIYLWWKQYLQTGLNRKHWLNYKSCMLKKKNFSKGGGLPLWFCNHWLSLKIFLKSFEEIFGNYFMKNCWNIFWKVFGIF